MFRKFPPSRSSIASIGPHIPAAADSHVKKPRAQEGNPGARGNRGTAIYDHLMTKGPSLSSETLPLLIRIRAAVVGNPVTVQISIPSFAVLSFRVSQLPFRRSSIFTLPFTPLDVH